MSDLVVVTGDRGEGKTSAIRKAAGILIERGVEVAGFVQLARIDEWGESTGYDLVDLRGSRRVALADAVDPALGEHGTRFRFHEDAFRLAGRALETRAAPVVMIDELGPLELGGAGHAPALSALLERHSLHVLVVGVRPRLVEACIDWVEPESVTTLRVREHEDPGARIAALVQRLVTP